MSATPASSNLPGVLAERTLELARISSPSGSEVQLADFVESFLLRETQPRWLRRHGPRLAATYGWSPQDAAAPAAPRLALCGHLDTVPESGHPEPEKIGQDLVGLGVTDMKGALAVMMTLAEQYPSFGARSLPLTLVFYDCEEIDYARNGLRKLFASEPWLREIDAALLLEPTDNALELGCVGSLHARATFHGVAAHSARPWLGRNAIHAAGEFLTRLGKLAPREVGEGDILYREVLSATLAEGGKGRNVVPERFTLNLNLRFPHDRSPAEAESYLRSLLPEGVTLEVVDRAPAAPPRLDSPVLGAFRERFSLPARAKQAWTDAAQFAEHHVPAANFGPGLPELAHCRDERIPVANLVRSHETLSTFIAEGVGRP